MADISRIASGAPWEPVFGYSRAVRTAGWIAVSGTTAFDQTGIVGKNQMYVQTRQAIMNIAAALERCGAGLADVVRTRVFVTDIDRFAEVARAHQEFFGANPPASTLVAVSRLVHPDMLVEIEADAYREPPDTARHASTAAGARKAAARIPAESKSSRARSSAKAVRKRR